MQRGKSRISAAKRSRQQIATASPTPHASKKESQRLAKAVHPKIFRPSNRKGIVRTGDEVSLQSLLEIDERVGHEIRDLRRAHDFTIADLSQETGLSEGFLSQIERGKSSPSVKALHAISRALGVPISWFFGTNSEDDEVFRDIVVRCSKRRKLHFNSGITDELLSPNLRREIELLRCIFKPGSASGDVPYTHQGEEAGFVVSGELHLWIGERKTVLKAGDSFGFDSSQPHRYENPTHQEAIVIW